MNAKTLPFILLFVSSFYVWASAQCDVPGVITATDNLPNKITINWTEVPEAERYRVYVIRKGTGPLIIDDNKVFAPASSYTVSGLTDNTIYEVRVRAKCNGAWGAWNIIDHHFNDTGASNCGPVTGITTTNITTTTATVLWDAMPADRYVFILRTATNEVVITDQFHGGFEDSYPLSNLLPNTAYKYKIRSICNGVIQPYSDWIPFTTLGNGGPTCDTATGLTTSNLTNTSATLSWDDMGADDYRLQVRIAGGAWIVNTLVSTNSYNIANLTPNTNYQFRVRSRCNGVWQDNTALVDFTTSGSSGVPCDIATGLSTSNVTDTSAILSWDDMSADEYRLQVKIVGGVWIVNTLVTDNFYHLFNLTPNTNYLFRVRSRCNGVWQDNTTLVDFTTNSFTSGDGHSSALKLAIENTPTYPNDEFASNEIALQISPNLVFTETKVSYSLPTATTVTLRIFDSNGKLVRELVRNDHLQSKGFHHIQLNTSDLVQGTYYLQLSDKNNLRTKKFMIIR